ncbi:uncharacterized protein METZ01_LOCUS513847, partial [marine metagenome]
MEHHDTFVEFHLINLLVYMLNQSISDYVEN